MLTTWIHIRRIEEKSQSCRHHRQCGIAIDRYVHIRLAQSTAERRYWARVWRNDVDNMCKRTKISNICYTSQRSVSSHITDESTWYSRHGETLSRETISSQNHVHKFTEKWRSPIFSAFYWPFSSICRSVVAIIMFPSHASHSTAHSSLHYSVIFLSLHSRCRAHRRSSLPLTFDMKF